MWSAGVAAFLAAAAAVALHALVDPERLRKAARDRALAAWERELLLGEVKLELLPVPALRAANVSFANPPWAREPHLLHADFVRADLELLPLLTGKVRIKRLSLDGLKAGLEVGEDGSVSWELKRAPAAPKKGAADEDDPLQIAAVHLRDARIAFRSGREEVEPWRVEEATIETRPGQKQVDIKARVQRYGRPLEVKAQLADLSGFGAKGAVTDGRLELDWGTARLEATGRFPLDKRLEGLDLGANFKASSLQPVLAFFGFARGKTAPFTMRFRARHAEGRIEVAEIVATLADLTVNGAAQVTTGARRRVHARLQADRIDWLKTLADAGGQVKPPRRDEEIFHADPVAWRAMAALGAMEGVVEMQVKSLRMGNGIELRNARTKMETGEGIVELRPFSAELLGGKANGAFRFDAGKKAVRAELDADNVLLGRWFHERGSKLPFEGGPMKVKARLALAGATYRELAASVSGTLAIRMGKGVWHSKSAGEAEEAMVRVLAPKDGSDVEFQCAAVRLDFKSGRASGRNIAAARTDVSQLLTSGSVDVREETLDLRGRLVPRSGPRIGLASIAGEVQVMGRLARPKMQLDPAARPAVLARAGAAIASAGATIIGSALIDSAESKNNPCDAVLR